MNNLEKRIATFSTDPNKITEAYALLKVGRDKGDSAETIMAHLIASILLDFHGIPIKPQTGN